jgi:superoxide reductase
MTNEIYTCDICGAVVEVVENQPVNLSCCGKPMDLQEEKFTENEGNEKHVPVIEGKTVKVGSIPHPMTGEHSIKWIEAKADNKTQRVYLDATAEPKAEFDFEPTSARACCNLHGLWRSQ